MRARFNSAFEMTPAGFSEGMVCAVPEAVQAEAGTNGVSSAAAAGTIAA
jgi:hypothetical protein